MIILVRRNINRLNRQLNTKFALFNAVYNLKRIKRRTERALGKH